MLAECNQESFGFHALGRRDVVARFDGGPTPSDADGLVLRRVGLKDTPMAKARWHTMGLELPFERRSWTRDVE